MILVTGSTGFIGSNLVKQLIKEGLEIAGICRETTDFSRVGDVYSKIIWVNAGDDQIKRFFEMNNVDGVIHLATSYGRNGGAFSVYESNVHLPMLLLENLCKNGSGFFINTDSFFTNELSGRWESGKSVYLDNYTKTKFAFKEYIRSNISTLGIKFINVQLQHIYGGNDSEGKFTSFLKKGLLNNVERIELTDGLQIRDWTHVDDVVSAYCTVLRHMNALNAGEFYEFEVGTGVGTSLKDFCVKMKEISGADTELLFGRKEMQANEIMASVANNESLKKLGWKPEISIEEGIRRLFEE